MRSSSAHTSAMRPEITMRPAQSGLMAESDSRKTRKRLEGNPGEAAWQGRAGASGPGAKAESLLATRASGAKCGCTVAPAGSWDEKPALWPSEFLMRLIHGPRACAGTAQNGCAAAFEKLMIFMNISGLEKSDTGTAGSAQGAGGLFQRGLVLLWMRPAQRRGECRALHRQAAAD